LKTAMWKTRCAYISAERSLLRCRICEKLCNQ